MRIKMNKQKENEKSITKLQHDVASLNEFLKMLQFKIDGIADQTAKLAIQEEGIVNAMDYMFKTIGAVAESKGIPMEKPSPPDSPGVQ